ncbi:uncharacterized protein B0H18DRAFT_957276 [Fomitopsis serialis]|uniref:uncharacterized protein n=1 Tax=Fomitopsis serialis TaxID=139415 RepID=UPI0020083496|nr:uncharacterized protein B0H18DRAFT_957276 [Neoantrodia serialis]KAH9919882.1 hypothetical protein B0H18DRAFT_957276 [Neoantrodia serialis]
MGPYPPGYGYGYTSGHPRVYPCSAPLARGRGRRSCKVGRRALGAPRWGCDSRQPRGCWVQHIGESQLQCKVVTCPRGAEQCPRPLQADSMLQLTAHEHCTWQATSRGCESSKVSPTQATARKEAFLVFCMQFVQTPTFRLVELSWDPAHRTKLEEELVKQTQGGPAELSASAPLSEFMWQSSGPTHEKLPAPLQRALEHWEAKQVTEKLGLKEPTEATKVQALEAMTKLHALKKLETGSEYPLKDHWICENKESQEGWRHWVEKEPLADT